jgi:DNA polymerase III epsilon subunit-like protein
VRVLEGEICDQFETLVCPQVEIEPGATSIHGIREEDVREAPTAREALIAFREWAGEDLLAAHNARFDAGVLGFEYARADLTPPPGAFIDSLQLARKHIPEAFDHKLDTLCQHLDLEEGPHHRALSDAVYCWMVIDECINRQGGPEAVSFENLRGQCGALLTCDRATPRAPRINRRLRPIEHALQDEADIVLVYGDTRQAPINLAVTPRFLYQRHKTGYLEGICHKTGTLKTYRLDRVHKVLSSA